MFEISRAELCRDVLLVNIICMCRQYFLTSLVGGVAKYKHKFDFNRYDLDDD